MALGIAQSSTYNLARSLWPQNSIYDILLKESVTLGLIPKDTSFSEKKRFIDVGSGAPQGVGPVFSTAKANKSASVADEFGITPFSYYSVFSIEGRLMRQAKAAGNKALLVAPLARESKNAINQWKRDISAFLHGNGGGALSQMDGASDMTGAVITLKDITKIRFFDRNMSLTTASTDGTSGAVNAGKVTVKAVNRRLGTITINEASCVGAMPAVVNTHYLLREGVFGNVLQGFDAWVPASDPTATLFNGVDRSVDTERLGGIRVDATGKTPLVAAQMAAGAVYDSHGNPDLYILNTQDWQNLRNDLQSAGSLRYTQAPAAPIGKFKPGMKYDAIEIMGPGGSFKVVADADAPLGVGKMLQTDTWTLASTGELVSMIGDGQMQEEAADAFESRFVGDLNMYTEAPGYNARVIF